MMYFQPGLYVVIQQLDGDLAPTPKPLAHGFTKDVAYLVLGAFSLSESGEAFLVLSNNENQIWFISNRHVRTHCLLPKSTAFRLPIESRNGSTPLNGHAPKTDRLASSQTHGLSRSKSSRKARG